MCLDMTVAEGGGIFVSYRRLETSHLAGRLYDRLAAKFGEDQVFIDVDAIAPGVDFAEEIFRAVAACQVLLALIGPVWLTAVDERGRRRLDDPDDLVRLEIEAALDRNVRVIPILVEGAGMPTRDDLPASLAGLARRNALAIRHVTFQSDVERLMASIERVLTASGAATARVGPHSTPAAYEAAASPQRETSVTASRARPDARPAEGYTRQAAFNGAALKPRTGDGPIEAVNLGGRVKALLPLEGGGRLAFEMPPNDARLLAEKLISISR